MSFITYSQNFEDIILHRALKNIKNGFYVDVGAGHPIDNSVTYAFYKLGWSGINIEPVEFFFNKLLKKRSKDINLKIALASHIGNVEMNISKNTGLSTINDEYAVRHVNSGFDFTKETIPCTTLDKVCSEYNVKTIHFLKIDVEGSESNVINGFSFNFVRPWILVIESTVPSTEVDNSQIWEKTILKKKYKFVYFDGLNKFYIAKEHLELEKYFKLPPNIFDGAITKSEFESKKKLHSVSILLESKEHEIDILRNEKQIMEKKVHDEKTIINKKTELLIEKKVSLNNEIKRYKKENSLIKKDINKMLDKEQLLLDYISIMAKIQSRYSNKVTVQELAKEIKQQNEEILKIYSTISWKLTAPLRHLKKGIKAQNGKIIKYYPMILSKLKAPLRYLKKYIVKILMFLMNNLDKKYFSMIKNFKIYFFLKKNLKKFMTIDSWNEIKNKDTHNYKILTASAEKIYFELEKNFKLEKIKSDSDKRV